MKYTIKLFRGMSQYNAYEGTSYTSASKMVDTLRATLVFSNGTAQIAASYNGGGNVPLNEVVHGESTYLNVLEKK